MELLGILVVAVFAYLLYLGVKFSNFRSQLMNEFGRRGISFEAADKIFDLAKDEINTLHHAGMPIDQIVDRYASSDVFGDTHRGRSNSTSSTERNSPPMHAMKQLAQEDTIRDSTPEDDKALAIIKFVSRVLGIQRMLVDEGKDSLPQGALDDWSLGYVAGVADAVLQANDYGTDHDRIEIIAIIFSQVFGTAQGPSLFENFMRLQEGGSIRAKSGMQAGGSEMFEWMADSSKTPTGWAAHVHGISKA